MASDPALFPRTTEDDWRRLAGSAATRVAVTDDGIAVAPIYPRRPDAVPLTAPHPKRGWLIIQRLTADNADGIVRQAAEAIAGGADGVEIVFESSVHPFRSRLPLASVKRVATGLAEMRARDLIVRLDAGSDTDGAAAAFVEALGGDATVVLAHDPIVALATRPERSGPAAGNGDAGVATGLACSAIIAIADGRLWHAGGASETQELAAVLATIVAYLRRSAVEPAQLAARLGVALAADVAFFPTLAKFRAMRMLLTRLCALIDAPGVAVPIHGESSWRMTAATEVRMNVLRATLAAAGAVTGGATSFAVLPYDATGTTSADSIRLARNTQLVLREEAQIGRVADPGAGSGAVEAMTGALAAKAWERFRAIEAEGGIVAAIRGKRLLNTLSERRSLRRGRAATGEIALIGVNANVAAGARINARTPEFPDGVMAFERLDSGFVADDPK